MTTRGEIGHHEITNTGAFMHQTHMPRGPFALHSIPRRSFSTGLFSSHSNSRAYFLTSSEE